MGWTKVSLSSFNYWQSSFLTVLILAGGETMFESLDETMKHDLKEASSAKERILLWISVAIVSVVVFGGLYVGVRVLE